MNNIDVRSCAMHAATVALCIALSTTHGTTATVVPMQIPSFAQSHTEAEARMAYPTDLSYGFGYHIRGKRSDGTGSYQHFEIDTFLHSGADVPFVFNGIFTLLAEGGSHAGDARTIGGADIRGRVDSLTGGSPCHVEVHDAGYIGTVKCFEASYAGDQIGKKTSFIDHDHASTHYLAGTTREIDALQFSNGWALVVNGDSLELHDARGIVQIFR